MIAKTTLPLCISSSPDKLYQRNPMRQTIALLAVLILTSITLISYSQTTDSLHITPASADLVSNAQTEGYHEGPEDDFAPGLALFALFGIGFMFICIGVGIVLTMIGLLILVGFIGAGIVSVSILVGFYNKSLEKGFRTFLVSTTTVGGLFIGGTGFWVLNKIMHWFTTTTSLIIGSTGGLITGFLLGIILSYVIKQLVAFFKDRLKATI